MCLKTLRGIFILGFACCSLGVGAATLQVDPEALKADYPEQGYTVRGGDTLWDVTGVFLRTPWGRGTMPEHAVPELRPGDHVSVIKQGARLFLQFRHGREVKLSPQVRVPRDKPAEKIIPLSAIQQFLNRPRLLAREEIEGAGYIMGNVENTLMLTKGDAIYARGLYDAFSGDTYTIVRPGQAYKMPGEEQEEAALYEAVYLGDAVVEKEGDPFTLRITSAAQEILAGDLLLTPEGRHFEKDFRPRPAPDFLDDGRIIAVVDGVSQIGQYQVVVVDKGAADGLEVGHELAIYKGGKAFEDKNSEEDTEGLVLPKHKAGDLMVFRVFDSVSYALVTEAVRVIHLSDLVGHP